MPRFWYTTQESEGRRQHLDADDLPHMLLTLQQQGVKVRSAGQHQPPLPPTRRVNEQLLTSFYEQLASLLDQGLELSVALRRIAIEAASHRLGRCVTLLTNRAADGLLLSEAMAEQPHIFAPLAVNMVAAAEEAGDLAEGLRSLSSHQRNLQDLGSRLALPLAYPVFLLTIIIAVLFVVATYIWPKFFRLFTDLGLEADQFPLPTLLVNKVIHFLLHGGLLLLIILLLALAVFYLIRVRTKAGQLEARPLGLPVPLFGRLARYQAVARAAGALQLLLKHGVPVGRALRLAGEASGNRHLSLAMRRAQQTVNEGGRVAEGLRATGLLPEEFVFSLAAAEASGNFVSTLGHLQTDYMRRVKELSHQWVVLAGPIVVVILGIIVGFVGVSMFLPLIEIIGQLSQ